MDWWSKLIGGVGTPKKEPPSNDPAQRLTRFQRVYNQILQTWQKSSSLSSDSLAAESLKVNFQRLTSLLHDESRSPAPHLCLSFSASSEIYAAISLIASTVRNEPLIREAVAVFAALIDSEEEDFLASERFAQSLMNFVGKIVSSGSIIVGEDTEADIVEMLFGIAAKIRLQPEILPVWFTSTNSVDEDGRSVNPKADFAGVTQKEAFPLCYQLIDHVHHEGRIGDFARTGLLYIFESASKSIALEQWIVESDLATLMASGLGALYSQLSRKLSILHPKKGLPIILTLSDYPKLKESVVAESYFSEEFSLHLETFLSYLTFWQDVLEHCRSWEVRQTLIDHFQILFLQQLLYPSLLESSDVDGGSSVAVLTYLRQILDALDHPELVRMILRYLLALPDAVEPVPTSPRSPLAAKRRRSLLVLNDPDDDDDRLNPSVFNLVDLILTSVSSQNSQTVVSALKLVTIILSKNHPYAVNTLLQTSDVESAEPQRTIGALDAEMEAYLELAMSFGGEAAVDEAYEAYLKDTLTSLETHPCYLQALSFKDPGTFTTDYFGSKESRSILPHSLLSEDPLTRSFATLLRSFLTNNVETNLAMTESVTTMASCSQLRLEGWLALNPSQYRFELSPDSSNSFGDEALERIARAKRLPVVPSDQDHTPLLLSCLRHLDQQVTALRTQVSDFDAHVTNRKQAFRVHEEISDAMKYASPQTPIRPTRPAAADPSTPHWAPQIPRHILQSPAPPSRSHSPRGRRDAPAPIGVPETPRQSRFAAPSSASASPAPSSRFGGATLAGSPPVSRDRSRGLSPVVVAPVPGSLMADVVGAVTEVAEAEALKQTVRFVDKAGGGCEVTVGDIEEQAGSGKDGTVGESEAAGVDGGDGAVRADVAELQNEGTPREASLNHVLTNVVVLQEFVLELVALMQVRSTLFEEVKFAM